MLRIACLVASLLLLGSEALAQQKTREQKVREDRAKVEAEGFWIYNDLAKGFQEAKHTGKPLLVVLRCIPCEECVKLDDEIVDQDPLIRPLLEKFICVRQVSTNGLDLSIFQFDTDQSFAVFMLNADGAIYGRFGTRSHRTEWLGDVSLPGLAKALEGALELHANYPKNQADLAGKRGPKPEFASPEKFPSLQAKYTASLNYSGNVVPSCIHCHQVGDAQREFHRKENQSIPESVLFPYPHPRSIGLILDPKEKATVQEVKPGNLAATSGLRPGDVIERMNGQPLLSIADVQWVLHRVPAEGGSVALDVKRGKSPERLTLDLPPGWKQAGDLSWRASSWGLRRMVFGGMLMVDLPAEERKKLGLSDDQLGLLIKHVGEFGAHAAAKKAGFKVGDVLVKYEGSTRPLTETDLLRIGVQSHRPGDRVPATVLRAGKPIELMIPVQD